MLNGERHENLISTQITLKERLDANPSLANLYYVLADTQSSGRGRSDRQWVSLAGNLHASILIRHVPLPIPTWVPLWVSICTHRALTRFGALTERIQLKWPNDLWLDERFKVGGVLCEKKGSEIIAGIGLNLRAAPIEDSAVVPFASLAASPGQILEALIEELASLTKLEQVQSYYRKHALFQSGQTIAWINQDQKQEGVVVGLGEYGELLVNTRNGQIPLYSEDVRSVSPPKEKDRSTSPNG